MLRLPFDNLGANGAGIVIIRLYPFVVSPENHKKTFFNSLNSQSEKAFIISYCIRFPLHSSWFCAK